MGKRKFVSNLNKTEWWPVSSVGRVKIVQVGSGEPWKVVVQMKGTLDWLLILESPLPKKDVEAWVEELFE